MRPGTLNSASVVALLWAAAALPAWGSVGLRLELPPSDGFHPPPLQVNYTNPLHSRLPAVLKVNTTLFTTHEDIDFERRQVTFSRTDRLGFTFWAYHYGELSDYLFGRQRYSLYQGWYEQAVSRTKRARGEEAVRTTLDFQLPVQYPKWAQRVLGKEPPKLSIDGYLTLTMSYDNTRQETQGTEAAADAQSDGFKFDQENKFTIRGTIGRVIDINISAGSNDQEDFDFENQLKKFKIEYKDDQGELEDEIIQEIVAGYTGFQMPGQGLAGYSESHEGLFGIKIKSKLGPVVLTTIASNEQGETQTLERSFGGASGGMTRLTERDYIKYRYFFLDSAYLRHYLLSASGGDTGTGVPAVTGIELWLRAVPPPGSTKDVADVYRTAKVNGQEESVKRISKAKYYLDALEGWVRLDSLTLGETDMLCVYLRTSGGALDKGDTTFLSGKSSTGLDVMTDLAVLKAESPAPANPTFYLAWRNVYRMPQEVDEKTFTIDVRDSVAEQGGNSSTSANVLISSVLGLTDASGKALLRNREVYDQANGCLIIPPFRSDTIGNQPFRNPVLGAAAMSDIYTQDANTVAAEHTDRFFITMTGSTDSRSTRIDNLGWGVMKGTEEVTGDGHKLYRDIDYVIDYEGGSIDLISEKAKAASSIKLKYQREALFVPDKKVFLGAHAQLALPFIGKSSFLGASVMWQDATTNDKIPRIGQEPYSRLLFDVNTSMDFEPEWMTKLVNLLPLVKTTAPSSAGLRFEVAHSRMNPNTDDRAYVEDFEASQQVYPLSEAAVTSWRQASPPRDLVVSDSDTVINVAGSDVTVQRLLLHPPAWSAYWFNPVDNDENHRIWRDSIWNLPPADRAQTASERWQRALRLHCQPAPADTVLRDRYRNAWAGIMTSVPASFADRREDKFFELWAHCVDSSRLVIDFGMLSEDVCVSGAPPNSKDDDEDTLGLGEANARLDLGLDRRPSEREVLWVPNPGTGSWDTLTPAALRDSLGEASRASDPAADNYAKYDSEHLSNYRYSNGLEGNGGVLNSEDVNLDGSVLGRDYERFFRAEIDFRGLMRAIRAFNVDSAEQLPDSVAARFFVDTKSNTAGRGWTRFRIPIHDSVLVRRVGSTNGLAPSLREIKGVRLIWDGFDTAGNTTEKKLLLTSMQFVGNQWQEVPTRPADSVGAPQLKISAATVNTVDDEVYRLDPRPGVTKTYDSHHYEKREQALRLDFWDLRDGEEALVERNYNYQAFDLSNYRRLTMLVQRDEVIQRDGVYFFFRFGTDSVTYYEYRTDELQHGWESNTIEIELQQLAQLKLAWLNARGDTVTRIDTTSADGRFRIYSPGGKLPTFSNIAWMGLGAARPAGAPGPLAAAGQLWVNEMKVSGVRDLNGWAARVSLSTKWADFMDFALSGDYTDGDFRTMTEDLLKPSASSVRASMDVSWRLDKFLPEDWGVSLPVGAMVSGSLSRPLQKPGTDIALTGAGGESDRLGDMFADAMAVMFRDKHLHDGNVTAAEHYQSTQLTRTWYTKYEKAAKSDKLATKLLAERFSLSYNYHYNLTTNARGEKAAGGDFVDNALSETYKGTLKYDLTPRQPPAWTRWKPFGKVKQSWFPALLKNYELTYLPSTLRFDLMDLTYARNRNYAAKSNKLDTLRTLDVAHGLAFNWEPIRPLLGLGYTLNVNRGLDDALRNQPGDDGANWFERWWRPVLSDGLFRWHPDEAWGGRYYLLYGEESRSQSANLDFKPQFVDWLSHDFSYRATYGERVTQWRGDTGRDYLDLSVGTRLGFNSRFELTGFLRGVSGRFAKLKGLSKTFSTMEKGLDKIGLRTVSFDYTATSDLRNNMVGTDYLGTCGGYWDFVAYQLGLKGRHLDDLFSGEMDDEQAFGGTQQRMGSDTYERYKDDAHSVSRQITLSTSLSLPEPLGLSINPLSLSWDERHSYKPDELWFDNTTTWPKLTVGAQTAALGNIAVVKKLLERFSLSTQYSWERTEGTKGQGQRSATGAIQAPTSDEGERHSWDPLLKVETKLRKRPISLRYTWGYSSDTRTSAGWSRTKKHSHSVGADYELQKALKDRAIKIFRWSIPIRGRLTAGATAELTHEYSWNGSRDATGHAPADATAMEANDPVTDVVTMSLIPRLTYVFTDNVNAELSYEGTKKDEKVAERQTLRHLIKIIIKITF